MKCLRFHVCFESKPRCLFLAGGVLKELMSASMEQFLLLVDVGKIQGVDRARNSVPGPK